MQHYSPNIKTNPTLEMLANIGVIEEFGRQKAESINKSPVLNQQTTEHDFIAIHEIVSMYPM